MKETVVGLFKTREEAEAAVRALEGAGFNSSEIGVAWPGEAREGDYGTRAVTGIGTGAVVGGVLGALVAGLLPVIGPVIAGGALVAILGGAFTGATTGGLAGGLMSMAASSDRALYYEQEVLAGRFLVSVTTDRPAEAFAVLHDSGALEVAPLEVPLQERR